MTKSSLTNFLRDLFFGASKLAIQRGWMTICVWLAIAVAGIFAFSSLKYALFPDFSFALVVVNTNAPIETALEMEETVTNPIEARVADFEGLTTVRSTTLPGHSTVTIEYDIGYTIETTTEQVKAAISGLDLPANAQTQIIPFNINETVATSYALLGSGQSPEELIALAEAEIIPAISDLPGVLRVDLLGAGAGAPTTPDADQTAEVQVDTVNPPTLVRFNGSNALAVQVIKRAEANTLEVVSQVEAKVAELETNLAGVQLVLATSQADFIREATQATIDALWLAIVLAIVVIFGFLRDWRATLITALAIPLSLLATFIAMAVSGFNLETITLLALALVIGIIVDDAIVEIENIIRHLEAGESPRQAALNATREISLTVSVSTLTIVAVFLPVALMGGEVGSFFKPFGLTVSAAVLASLLIARTLTPVLAVYWLRPRVVSRETVGPTDQATAITDTIEDSWLTRTYGRLLAWALDHRRQVVGLAIASLILGVALIPLIPQGFIPKLDRGDFNVVYTTPLPEISTSQGEGSPEAAPQLPADLANLPPDALANLPPELAAQVINPPSDLPTIVNPFAQLLENTRAVGAELETPILAEADVEAVFTTVGGRGEPNRGRIYVTLTSDRSLSTAQMQDRVRAALPKLEGVTISVEDVPFVDTGGEKPLQVIISGENLEELHQAAAEIQSRVSNLPGFVDVSTTGMEGDIEHRDGQRVAYISANLSEDQALGDATRQVVDVAKAVIPESVRIGLGGDSERIGEVLGSFGVTLGLAVICMLVVLFLPFGRLLEPAVVGLSLPLAIGGAMLALLVTQSDFGMVSVIGLLFLLGLLDKNALLLMDYANQLRQTGLSRREAIFKTGLVRLRPILMTTASTVLGMLPIALGWGAGAELRQPMAVAIIGGLITSTLLSLVVVPVLYTLLEDLGFSRNRQFL